MAEADWERQLIEKLASAGVPAVAVSYGAHAKADLAPLAPLACLDSIDELTQWLTRNG